MQNFNDLYQQHYSSVYVLANKLLNNTNDSADVTQEVFINLYQEINKKNVILFPKTWLYRVTINKSINHLNREKKYSSLDENDHLQKIPDKNVLNEIDNDEKKKILLNALNQLKPMEKAVIILYSEGLSYKEISEISEVQFKSVGKLISRTLEKLKKQLKDLRYELLND